jgi:hypothetical protein
MKLPVKYQAVVTCRPIARYKQACDKYATNNRVEPSLGNANNNRTGVEEVFSVWFAYIHC